MILHENHRFGLWNINGVPVIGCQCAVCLSEHPYNHRTRASVAILTEQNSWIVIDTGPEFRIQVLREKIVVFPQYSTPIYTLITVLGLDDLRAFSFRDKHDIPVLLSEEFEEELKSRFYYVFKETGYRGSKPKLDLHPIKEGKIENPYVKDLEMFRLPHGSIMTSAYRIGRFFYATDFKTIGESQIAKLRGEIDVAIMSGIHFGEHDSHSTVLETVDIMKKMQVKRGMDNPPSSQHRV